MELNFMNNLANERIKEKIALIKNDIFFKYAIENGFFKVNNKEEEINFYNKHIENLSNYLINCGVSLDFIKDAEENTKMFFREREED